jgi:membrane peptidoglycan carboxypeptidase
MGDLPKGVVTFEDPGFYKHHGFIGQAFANSLADNVRTGKFLRGGSTITMQLAKNLWLSREKTLGRKAQEFFLAQALESCYSKAEILELYLNVVEFGPGIYGAAAGAQHWFDRGPAELERNESFWMASILPRPKRASAPTSETLEKMEARLRSMEESGLLSKEEEDEEFQNE